MTNWKRNNLYLIIHTCILLYFFRSVYEFRDEPLPVNTEIIKIMLETTGFTTMSTKYFPQIYEPILKLEKKFPRKYFFTAGMYSLQQQQRTLSVNIVEMGSHEPLMSLKTEQFKTDCIDLVFFCLLMRHYQILYILSNTASENQKLQHKKLWLYCHCAGIVNKHGVVNLVSITYQSESWRATANALYLCSMLVSEIPKPHLTPFWLVLLWQTPSQTLWDQLSL